MSERPVGIHVLKPFDSIQEMLLAFLSYRSASIQTMAQS